jgi:antibiotic biosynthesis monooxygenase (ABM) superfamily enzyme
MKSSYYEKCTKYWPPRNWVLTLVVEAVFTGLFLGMTLFVGGHDAFLRMLFLVLTVSSGVGTLQATLVVLYNCSPVVKTGRSEAVSPLAH